MRISEAQSIALRPEILELLSFAASKAGQEYEKYLNLNKRKLYACEVNDAVAGVIGIEFLSENSAEIKHIAVSPEKRGQRIGAEMIEFVCGKYRLSTISAETDEDAVDFYRRSGFHIKSLGEKYPGRERFWCCKAFSNAYGTGSV